MRDSLYKKAAGCVIRLADGAFVPADLGNQDYRAYLDWTAAGGTTAPERSLDEAKALVLASLETGCAAAITAGFASTALGKPHRYPAKPTDQSNLQASVLASLLPGLAEDWTTPFWCQDAAGTWAYRPHSAAQIQQAGTAGKDAISTCIAYKIALEEQLAKAQTLEEIEAITWTPPQ